MKTLLLSLLLGLAFGGLVVAKNMGPALSSAGVSDESGDMQKIQKIRKATFAGGCFWCMEKPFEKLDGVLSVVSGYAGGSTSNPTYKNYAKDGHVEVVEIRFQPEKVSYRELLDVFWRQIDPTDPGGQFYDRGYAYSTGIFYHDEEQKRVAEASKEALIESRVFSKPIVTPILPASPFFQAEGYHQDYYKKNPVRYNFYRARSGRDAFLKKAWKEKKETSHLDRDELKKRLTPLQYKVTQEDGTEPPFSNKYWNNKKRGIYVDIVSGEPLFSSLEKYDSKTGWPSFFKPLEEDNIVEKDDWSLFARRTEVRSKKGDSHLGHLFNDGPQPTGLRYCINSAALRFIPVAKLEKEGYGEYAKRFE